MSQYKPFDYVWRVVFVFVGYYLGSKLGFALTFPPFAVSTLWPPNAILLGGLLISPVRFWPGIFLSAFFAHVAVQFTSEVPPIMILCWFVSNSLEALIGAGLLRKVIKDSIRTDSLSHVVSLFLFAAFLAPFLSSFVDAAFVKMNHWGTRDYWQIWKMRFFSNVLAELTLVPVIVGWHQADYSFRKVSISRFVEFFLFAIALVAVSLTIFNSDLKQGNAIWVYLPVPILLWAAIRFGFNILTLAIVTVTFISIWGAVHGRGPFHLPNREENALFMQIFLIVFSVPLFLFAAVLNEAKKAKEIALQNEERLRLALSAAAMTTWDLHIPSNQITWSEHSPKIVGADLEKRCLSLKSFLEILHHEDRKNFSKVISRTIAEGGTYELEFRILLPGGEILWQYGKGQLTFDEHGQPIRVLGVNADITERKRAEQERRKADAVVQEQKQELFHLSRVTMLAELSGTIAHELNQPLTAILSNAQAAQRYLAKDPVNLQELREIIDAVIEQDRRAGDVIKRLRALLKKGEPELRPIQLNQMIEEVLRLLHSEFVTHNVKVTTEFQDQLPKQKGDRVQLQQVLLNLIINALDAMKSVDLPDRELKITSHVNDESNIQITISDRGEGIPLDKLDKVFEPFFTTKEHGLGLGLAISRAIVVAHGGKLSVTNNADRGTTFLLTLPLT